MTDRMQKMPSTAELPMAKSPLTKTASEKGGGQKLVIKILLKNFKIINNTIFKKIQ